MAKNDRKGHPESAADVLRMVLKSPNSPLSPQFTRWKLWRFWSEAVGEDLALVSRPVDYHHGRLVVWVRSSACMQEMMFIVSPLIKKINQFIGHRYVTNIRFTLDTKDVPANADVAPEIAKFIDDQK